MTETTIRPGTPADVEAIVGVLSRAFDRDPVVNWLIRQDERRAEALAWYFRLSVRLSMPLGRVYTADDGAGAVTGVAGWAPPGRWGEGRWRQLTELPGLLRAIGLRRVPAVLPPVMALEAKHPRRPHFYLFEIAVDPPWQGRGVGSALLQPVLEECDRSRMPAYLESSNPRNNPLYERHGFRITERHVIAGGGPPVWLMWREPAVSR